MDITSLQTFLEVAKVRHFGRAADNLCVTQSAVSARVRGLEEALGQTLFVRERSNIHLSNAGEAFLNYARNIVENWDRANQALKLPDQIKTRIDIGGLPGIWDMLLQPWLHKIMRNHADMAISAEVLSEDSLLGRISNRSLDLAFVYDAPRGKYLNSMEFAELPLVLVSSRPNQTVEEALGDDYTFVDWGSNFAVQHAKNFPNAPYARLQTTQGRVAYERVKALGGAAYLAKPMVVKAIKNKELFKVKKAPTFIRAAYAVFHQKTEKTSIIQSLLDLR